MAVLKPSPPEPACATRTARAAALWGALAGASAAFGESLVLIERNRAELGLGSAAALVLLLLGSAVPAGGAAGWLIAAALRRRHRLGAALGLAALPSFYAIASWFGEWNTGRPYAAPIGLAGALLLAATLVGIGHRFLRVAGAHTARWAALLLIAWPPLFSAIALGPYRDQAATPVGPLQPLDPADPQRRMRVLVLALDGLDPAVVEQLAARGELPHLAALIRSGSSSKLASLPHQASPSLWASAFTGVAAERHGVLDFIVVEGLPSTALRRVTYPAVPLLPWWNRLALPAAESAGLLQRRITGSADRGTPAVWELLESAGDRCAVLGPLASHPAQGATLIASDRFFLGRPGSVAPTELEEMLGAVRPTRAQRLSELRSALHLDPEDWRALERGGVLETPLLTLDRALERDAAVLAAARAALRLRRFDLALVYLRLADDVSHAAWLHFRPPAAPALHGVRSEAIERFRDLVPGAYRYLDRAVGELARRMGEDAIVIVLSDHGFASYRFGASHYQSPDGLLILAGPGVQAGARLAAPRLFDLAPTLLLLRGQPIPLDLAGRPWSEALSPELGRDLGLRLGPPLPPRPRALQGAAPADPELLERFRALGYLK